MSGPHGLAGRPDVTGRNGLTGRGGPGVAHRDFASGLVWGLAPVVATVVLALGSVALRL